LKSGRDLVYKGFDCCRVEGGKLHLEDLLLEHCLSFQ
jgi:hypothetical protein